MSLLGILAGLGLLVALAFRGWSVLLLAPIAALIVLAEPGSAFPACAPLLLKASVSKSLLSGRLKLS